MKNLKIDKDAHGILVCIREELKEQGIENPNISDAIRELKHRSNT